MLVNTRHYLFGISGDQSFRVEYLTRFVDSAAPRDFAYSDIPAYYPSAWFWIGGRIARLAGLEAWAAYKPLAITTMAVVGVLAYCFWTLVTGRVAACAAAVGTTLVGLHLAAYTPYSWLTAALVAPVAVLTSRMVQPHEPTARRWVAGAALVGLILGTAAITHTQIFWFLAMVLVVVLLDSVVASVRRHGEVHRPRRLLAIAGVAALTALPLVLVVWTPYALGVLRNGGGSGAAQRYLPSAGATLPLPMLQPTAVGVLAAAATVWIALRFNTHRTARALGLVVLCGYAWYALSTLALVVDTTLLPFRIEPVITAALVCAAVPAAEDLGRLLDRVSPRERAGGALAKARNSDRTLPVAAGLLAVIAIVATVQAVPSTYAWSTAAQESDYYPDGTRPVGASADSDDGRWNAALLAAIDAASGKPADQVVVLSTYAPVFVYRPYWTFQTTIAQYANPLADFDGRNAEIRHWASSSTPVELLSRLDRSAARPPSVFVLRREADGLNFATTEDAFPRDANTRTEIVSFKASLFDDPAFTRSDVGPFTLVVRRDVPPGL
jgi:galactan 5-O-arabinofuranosyltransferase